MKPTVLFLLSAVLLAGCDPAKTTFDPASDPALAAKHAAHVEAVLMELAPEADELHIDNLKNQHDVWIGFLELTKRIPALTNLDPAALINDLGLASAAATGRSITKDGDLWLMRHYAHYPDGFPPALDLWGETKPFTMATLPAATDVAIEFRLNATSIPQIIRQHAKHTGDTEGVESWLKIKSPNGPTWEEAFSVASVDVLLGIFNRSDWKELDDQFIELILKVRTDKALMAAYIPMLVDTLGEPQKLGGLKGWILPESWGYYLPFEHSVLLIADDNTFIVASSLEHWQAVNATAEVLGDQPDYQAATRHFPESGTIQAYFSPMISSIAREWMETMILEKAELRGFDDVEVKLTPDQPWATSMARGESGVLTYTKMPFANDTRDTTAMSGMSGPGTAFIGLRSWIDGSERAGCIINIRNVHQTIRGHQGMRNLRTGDEIDWDFIFGPRGYMPKPQCPAGGTYTYSKTVPPNGVLACTCSHAKTKDHEPDDYSDW